jgi:hypothetical protein
MSVPKSHVAITPRLLSHAELARYLGRSEEWLRTNRARLEALGFPAPHPIFGGTDRQLVDHFLARTAGGDKCGRRKRTAAASENTLIARASEWDA